MLMDACCTYELPVIRLAFLAAVALVACSGGHLRQVAFCDLVVNPPMFTENVRVTAVGIFTDIHGAVLTHPDCPTRSAVWDESDAFQNDSSYHVLREARNALEFDVSPPTSLDPEALELDLTAHYRWQSGRPVLIVDTVHSIRRVPMVYASEFERNFNRCQEGPLPGPRSEEWHAACDAAEEWFRAERARKNN